MERIFQRISRKMSQAFDQVKQNEQFIIIQPNHMDRVIEFVQRRFSQKNQQAIQELESALIYKGDVDDFIKLVSRKIGQKQQASFAQLQKRLEKLESSGLQLNLFQPGTGNTIEYNQQMAYPSNNYPGYQNQNMSAYQQHYPQYPQQGQFATNAINNQDSYQNDNQDNYQNGFGDDYYEDQYNEQPIYQNNYPQNYEQSPLGTTDFYAQLTKGNNQMHSQLYEAQKQITNEVLNNDAPNHEMQNQGAYNMNNAQEQDNPQNIYRKQFKTKQFRNKKDLENGQQNKFKYYKKQLQNLQDSNYLGQTTPLSLKQYHQVSSSLNATEKMALIANSQLIRKKSQKSIYRINKQSAKKYSVKKQKQAESQMVANIQFLKSIRGTNNLQSSSKQWKQQTKHIKDTLQSIRQAKKKNLQSLGFTDSSKIMLNSKLEISSPQRSDLLPQIKRSRKKALIHKPAPFSVYSLQKQHQIFVNKTVK